MNNKTLNITYIALMAAVMCICGPISIPIGPVPISLTNLVIYITMYILGTKRGLCSFLIYLLIGLAGFPVFSGYTGGPAKFFGPTGGYLIGLIPMAFVCGLVFEKYYRNRVVCVVTMEAATWIAYIMGSLWLAWQGHMSIQAALAAGVLPFIAEDFGKMIISAMIGPVLKERLSLFTQFDMPKGI